MTSRTYRTIQLQIVHRHGDRTPITPLIDEDYWASTLIPPTTLDSIAQTTHIVSHDKEKKERQDTQTHKAHGRGPFGKLTQLGLLQMIQVGNALRDHYSTGVNDKCHVTQTNKNVIEYWYPYIWSPERHPFHPSTLRVYSTDFERAIQSVQGLLVGLFPNVDDYQMTTKDENLESSLYSVPIDIRLAPYMIPDPTPRHTKEQEELEVILTRQIPNDPAVLQAAVRITRQLQPLLAKDAHTFSFGVDDTQTSDNKQNNPNDDLADQERGMEIELEPLSFNQLAEITKCLQVRKRLPPAIQTADIDTIHKHTAQRWFHNLRHPRLVYLAMNTMVNVQLESMMRAASTTVDSNPEREPEPEPPVTIWSAHDSTLIGMLCAYRLLPPTKWPDYASYLVAELLQVTTTTNQRKQDDFTSTSSSTDISQTVEEEDITTTTVEYLVRFFLNGELLQIQWDDDEEPMNAISLTLLAKRWQTAGGISTF